MRAGRSAVLAFAAWVAGCSGTIEGTGDYGYSRPGTPAPRETAGATVTDECIDPSGFGGRGCFKCAANSNDQLLTACTDSKFEVFDNPTRIAGFSASTPRPSLPDDLGPTPSAFAGASETTDTTTPPPCPVDTKPNPVMVLGATGFPMETIAKAMGDAATIFYSEKGSCDGVASMVIGAPKMEGVVAYWDTDGTKNRCTLQETHSVDVALSALFASSCANESGLAEPVGLPADIGDFLGPVNPVMFAVPATSRERAISAEAAYRVYGFGDRSGVSPWTDEDFVFRRTASSGTQQTIALTLGLPADEFRGRDATGASNMMLALLQSSAPSKTIGISTSEIVDANRDVMHALAYRHWQQPVAFYPDSDPGSLDRRNVRDGHYFMWMPLHVMTRVANGEPVNAVAKHLVYVMTSRQQAPVPSVDLFGALKRLGDVPQCAMHVTRKKEGAPLEAYSPPVACDCAFESALPGTTGASCKSCKTNADCASAQPTCSFGFCQ